MLIDVVNFTDADLCVMTQSEELVRVRRVTGFRHKSSRSVDGEVDGLLLLKTSTVVEHDELPPEVPGRIILVDEPVVRSNLGRSDLYFPSKTIVYLGNRVVKEISR